MSLEFLGVRYFFDLSYKIIVIIYFVFFVLFFFLVVYNIFLRKRVDCLNLC